MNSWSWKWTRESSSRRTTILIKRHNSSELCLFFVWLDKWVQDMPLNLISFSLYTTVISCWLCSAYFYYIYFRRENWPFPPLKSLDCCSSLLCYHFYKVRTKKYIYIYTKNFYSISYFPWLIYFMLCNILFIAYCYVLFYLLLPIVSFVCRVYYSLPTNTLY